jgi:hypothetical protein
MYIFGQLKCERRQKWTIFTVCFFNGLIIQLFNIDGQYIKNSMLCKILLVFYFLNSVTFFLYGKNNQCNTLYTEQYFFCRTMNSRDSQDR